MQAFELKKDVLYAQLKKDILSGKYPPSSQLPKETDLARQFKVAKVTLRAALSGLESDGLIARVHGKGTFILPRRQDPQTVIVITDNLEAFANPSLYILEGIKSAALKRGISIKICERKYIEVFSPESFIASLKENHIVGIIPIMSYFIGDEYVLKILKAGNVPVLLPHAYPTDHRVTGFATIMPDMRGGWRDAVRHLCAQGHRRIATLVHTISPDIIRGHTREEHKSLLSEYGATPDDEFVKFVPYEKEAVAEIVKEWVRLPAAPTAILCFSDYFGIYVYEALKGLGIRIPDDIAVMGFCGYPGAVLLDPPLSTIDVEYHKTGELALEIMADSRSWYPRELHVAVPQVVRQCVCRPRGSTNIRLKF